MHGNVKRPGESWAVFCLFARDVRAVRLVMHTNINASECVEYVERLAAFGTRHTLSTTTDGKRGIGAARLWLSEQLRAFGGNLRVELESHDAPVTARTPSGGELVNVVAMLPGRLASARHRRVYCMAHYDSMNADIMNAVDDAPGANDNASGCGVVLACAKALANTRPDATIVFLLTAGEEQGLLGARAHAQALRAQSESREVIVLNNDTVGDPGPMLLREGLPALSDDPTRAVVRMFSEGLPKAASGESVATIRTLGGEHDSPSRQLARAIAGIAQQDASVAMPWLIARPDRFLRGGDHTPFNECGFAAVRFTSLAEEYSRQHVHPQMRDGRLYGDVPSFVQGEYLAAVARLNCKALRVLANAPSSPANARIVAAGMEQDTLVRWDSAAEEDVARYEVLWRDTTSNVWQASRSVDADVRELRVGVSKDNAYFAVRAVDADGNASVPAFCVAANA